MDTASPTRRSPGARLRATIELAMPALRASGRRVLEHPDPRAAYRAYLVAAHGVVRASVPLMEAALAAAESTSHDPAGARLAEYLRAHLVEEADHDAWILEDLEVTGVDAGAVLERPPSPAVAALVGAQYYWIAHCSPVVLLGYMAVLEGSPPSGAAVEWLAQRTGFDRRAFRALREHAVVDVRHGDEVFAVVDEVAISPRVSSLLGMSGLHTVGGVTAVLDEVVARAGTAPDLPGPVLPPV